MSKITLLTAASLEYWPILEKTAPNKLQYCLKHKVDLIIKQHTENVNNERETFALDSLQDCDWLWFMGSDTLIMNQTIDVRQFLDPEYDFIIGLDVNGINNDVYFLKNNHKSREFLQKTWNYNKTQPNDQESMKLAMKEVQNFKVKIVPQKEFNCYLYSSEYNYPLPQAGDYVSGDFILHLPGMPNSRRLVVLDEYLQKVQK